MNEIVVSEIQIIPVKPQEGLVAFSSCVVNEFFYLGNIAIYTTPSNPDTFRLVYPMITLPNGKRIHCFYPINREAGQVLQQAIVEKYKKIVEGIIP